ncbi:hypothetical protein ACFQZZ_22155 [Nocardia sp. GCM10030253]|uniref:hypothetical protein n=1 Tax=Nocardia sp. GCM10030253 TaxID=3273404 RepID=UPI003637907C
MVELGGSPAPGGGDDNTRILAIAAVLTAVLALVVAIGLLMRSNQRAGDSETPTPPTSTVVSTAKPKATSVDKLPPASQSHRPTSLVPTQQARRLGDDCSHDGIIAHWDLRDALWVCVPQQPGGHPYQVGDDCSSGGIAAQLDVTPDGRWVCVPQEQRRDEHQIGDDCSYDDIIAQWGLNPDGRWVCVPQGQRRDEHQIGDDCSHDGIIAQWGLTPDGQWVCIPQEQGVADEPEPFPAVPGVR